MEIRWKKLKIKIKVARPQDPSDIRQILKMYDNSRLHLKTTDDVGKRRGRTSDEGVLRILFYSALKHQTSYKFIFEKNIATRIQRKQRI